METCGIGAKQPAYTYFRQNFPRKMEPRRKRGNLCFQCRNSHEPHAKPGVRLANSFLCQLCLRSTSQGLGCRQHNGYFEINRAGSARYRLQLIKTSSFSFSLADQGNMLRAILGLQRVLSRQLVVPFEMAMARIIARSTLFHIGLKITSPLDRRNRRWKISSRLVSSVLFADERVIGPLCYVEVKSFLQSETATSSFMVLICPSPMTLAFFGVLLERMLHPAAGGSSSGDLI